MNHRQQAAVTAAQTEIAKTRDEVSTARVETAEARKDARVAQQEALSSYTRLREAERLILSGRATGGGVVLPQNKLRELERLTKEQPQIFRERVQR